MSGEEGHGYKKLIVWQNAKKLRKLIYDITKEEFASIDKLCGTTDYLLKRLIASVKKKVEEGTWK